VPSDTRLRFYYFVQRGWVHIKYMCINHVRAAIDDLEEKLAHAKAKAKDIEEAADDTWDDMKESLESGWNEASSKLEESWNNLSSTVKSFFS